MKITETQVDKYLNALIKNQPDRISKPHQPAMVGEIPLRKLILNTQKFPKSFLVKTTIIVPEMET